MRDLRLYLLPLLSTKNVTTHFSKGPSNLSQNETREKAPFVGKVFHALSHGVVRFVWTCNLLEVSILAVVFRF